LVRSVQNLRKELGLEVTDRIRLFYDANDLMASSIADNSEYLANETLAIEITRSDAAPENYREIELGSEVVKLSITRIP
jgi:isoleucyl-tRNA synthetase